MKRTTIADVVSRVIVVIFVSLISEMWAAEVTDGCEVGAPKRITIDELRLGHAWWQESVSFRSRYRLREGTAKNLADAFDGIPFDHVTRNASGVYNKDEKLVRISIKYREPPVAKSVRDIATGEISKPHESADGSVIVPSGSILISTPGPEDEIRLGDRWLVYRPKTRISKVDRAVFSMISDTPERKATTGQSRISPLNPFPGYNPDPFAGEAVLTGAVPEIEINSHSNDIAVVTVKSVAVFGEKAYFQTNVIEFWMKPALPVVRRVHRLIVLDDGSKYLEREARLSDFQQTSTGVVARRVLFAAEWNGRTIVKEWVSDDLGKELPGDEDFQIKIPENTLIVRAPLSAFPSQTRTLDIDMFP